MSSRLGAGRVWAPPGTQASRFRVARPYCPCSLWCESSTNPFPHPGLNQASTPHRAGRRQLRHDKVRTAQTLGACDHS